MGQDHATYKLEQLAKGRRTGISGPIDGLVRAVVKMDSAELPFCVYSEIVAVRLARLLGAPVADGAPVMAGPRVAYASLELTLAGARIPDLTKNRISDIVSGYADEAAAILVFDLWIGNWDRANNIKSSTLTENLRLFRAFDHGHALLGIESDPADSVRRLGTVDCIALHHPFAEHVEQMPIAKWIERLQQIPDFQIDDACDSGDLMLNVSGTRQRSLAIALSQRRHSLDELVAMLID